MNMAWIQTLDVAGAFLAFTALFAVLLLLGKVSGANSPSKRSTEQTS